MEWNQDGRDGMESGCGGMESGCGGMQVEWNEFSCVQ